MNASDAALLIMTLVVCWSLYRAHMRLDNSFNLFDLIMEGGKVSRLGFGFITALLVTSWVLVRIAREPNNANLSVIFSAYGAMWVIPIVAKLFSAPPPASATTTTATTTTITEGKNETVDSTRG